MVSKARSNSAVTFDRAGTSRRRRPLSTAAGPGHLGPNQMVQPLRGVFHRRNAAWDETSVTACRGSSRRGNAHVSAAAHALCRSRPRSHPHTRRCAVDLSPGPRRSTRRNRRTIDGQERQPGSWRCPRLAGVRDGFGLAVALKNKAGLIAYLLPSGPGRRSSNAMAAMMLGPA